MAGKPWTEEKRAKIASIKAAKREIRLKEIIPLNSTKIIEKKAPTDPSMVSPEEVFSADELLERAARLERIKEAQIKKINNEKSLVKDNATNLTYIQKIVSVNTSPQPTVAKHATLAELVKELESKKASQEEITLAIDDFTNSGMKTPSLSEIDKLNIRNQPLGALKNGSVVQGNLTTPEITSIRNKFIEPEVIGELDEQKLQTAKYLEELGKGKIWLLFPCFSDTNAATTWALVITAKKYGDKINMDMESGDSMIVNSRNKLAARFLETGSEWSVWLDSDMIPPVGNPEWFRYMTFCDEWADTLGVQKIPQQILETHFIDRLLSHGQKLVGSMYVGRQLRGRPMFNEGINTVSGNKEARTYPNQLAPTDWVGTGCMLVHRQVYIDMQNAYPELAPTQEMPQWDFFRLMPGRGEDASFCSRALKIGHQPYVDLGLHCAHVGKASYGPWNTNNKQLGV